MWYDDMLEGIYEVALRSAQEQQSQKRRAEILRKRID